MASPVIEEFYNAHRRLCKTQAITDRANAGNKTLPSESLRSPLFYSSILSDTLKGRQRAGMADSCFDKRQGLNGCMAREHAMIGHDNDASLPPFDGGGQSRQ